MSDAPHEISRSFAEFAQTLLAQGSVQATIDEVCALAVDDIEGCQYASVSLVRKGGTIDTPAYTDPIAPQIDRVQYTTGQGPCIEAIWESEVFHIADMSAEQRWPEFTAQVQELGVMSMLAFRLFTHENTLGALNLLADKPNVFGAQTLEVGPIFASHAAVALASAQTESNLREAIRSRQRIGEATGILMERHKLTDRQAFSLLAKASQNLNIKLRDLADEVAATGTDPAEVDPA